MRIAVFNWLFARHHGGSFVLRIEDTDAERARSGSEEQIYEDLRWLGLEWDEGPERGGAFGPYRQSQRSALYRTAARELIEQQKAYPCYCTPEELEAERKAVGEDREVLRYSGRCRELDADERRRFDEEGRTSSVRFASPRTGEVHVEDEIRGTVSFPASEIEDFVILRSDRRPTYNFAVVVDDAAMEISHVIRGAGHLSNTPRQALLLDALEESRPRFAHLPTVLSPEGGKLSKREDAAAVSDLREEGYHPDGIVNYVSLLGWSSPDEEEVLTRSQLIERIGLGRVGVSDTIYDPEKLRWLSGQHIARTPPDDLPGAVVEYLDRDRFPLSDEELRRALEVLRTRLTTFSDVNEHLPLLHPDERELEASWRALRHEPEARRVLKAVRRRIEEVEPWEPGAAMEAIREAGREAGARGRELFHPVRSALTAADSGPELGGVLWALGRKEASRRLEAVFREGGV